MSSSAAAARPAAPPPLPRALPAWAYRHEEMTRLEIDRILVPSWQIVCHVNAIPKPGDFVTFDLGSNGVVALRDAQGEIRAFHNVCRHRGARILDGIGHCAGAITCPYHGWSYRLSGELRAVTERDTFPGLERGDWGLKPVRSQVVFGFVFVCLAGDPPPVEEVWGRLAQELAPHRIADMQPLGPMYIEHWDCDWKIAMDNYLESYHVPIGHPGLFRMFTPDYEDQVLLPGGVARGISRLREQPSSRWSERFYQRLVVPTAAGLPPEERHRWSFYSMLPNIGIDIFPEQMDFFQVLPRGPGRCTIRGGSFAHPDSRREMRVLRYLGARINRQVQREDEFLCDRVQRGLGSRSYEPGPLSQLESCMLQFHDLLRSRIPEVREPGAPARFA
ncbi:MAG TPA: aromatic ring-hydroxylating dioxygenase subunit alpha [Steroidobacteraceae bacterium]|nr:aromatic ring-hydroxylating dioxygenase subunit alpha [Steroidobacteraceae bacterium]